MQFRKLRIAHFGRYAEGDTDIVKSMFLSLKLMGHQVQEWNIGKHPEWVFNPRDRHGGNGPIYIRLKRIKSRVLKFKPDLIICNAGGLTFSRSDKSYLEKKGIPVLGIILSDPDVMTTMNNYVGRYTWFTTNSLKAYKAYKRRGCKHVFYFPFGIDHRFIIQRALHPRYQTDVAVIGHGRPDRLPIARALCARFKTKLYGKNWNLNKRFCPGPVRGEAWFKAAYSTKMLINFPRTAAGHTNVKVGIFEAAATGKLLFTEKFDEMSKLFKYNKEIIGYRTKKDLLNKISYYLKHPDEAKKIGSNAKRRVMKEHLWTKRFQKLFQDINL